MIAFECVDAVLSFGRTAAEVWAFSSVPLRLLQIAAILVISLIFVAFALLYAQIFCFKEKAPTIKKYLVNRPTGHRTVFKYEIEQKIETKLKNLD